MSTWGKLGRWLSFLIGIAYAAFVIVPLALKGGPAGPLCLISLECMALIAIPVALIWFPEQIGAATGFIGNGAVNAETPPFLVAFMGWLFLLGMPVLYFWLHHVRQ